MIRATLTLALCICLAAGSARADDKSEAKQLLKKHKEASDWLKSVSMRVLYEYEQHGSNPGRGTKEGILETTARCSRGCAKRSP
jgi:hypothetical protein